MPLSSEQYRHFQDELESRYRELREEISEELRQTNEDSYVELAGRVSDLGEASVAGLIQDIELANISRLGQRAEAMDRALLAVRTGDYGECVECGGDINPERLEVIPWAERCIDCQDKWEREHLTNSETGSLM